MTEPQPRPPASRRTPRADSFLLSLVDQQGFAARNLITHCLRLCCGSGSAGEAQPWGPTGFLIPRHGTGSDTPPYPELPG